MAAAEGPKCRACGAPIVWAESERGRMMPIDAEPSPRGNLIKIGVAERVDPLRRRYSTVPIVGVVAADDPSPAERYLSHFASCPHADQLRKGKR